MKKVLKKVMRAAMLSCQEATLAIEKDAHGMASPLERLRLKLHLSVCKACSAYLRHSRAIDCALENHGPKQTDEKLSQEERAALKALLQNADTPRA